MQIDRVADTSTPRSTPQNEVHSEVHSSEEAPLLKSKRVVIVEDEGITQMQLRKMFRRDGWTLVGTAMSGPEGVETTLREIPDLVLMDIQIYGEYNGLEAARRILAERSVCIVMLTAFSDDGYREQARQIGVSGYVIKPIAGDTLLPQLEAAYAAWKSQ